MDITKILSEAPALIAERAEKENKYYANMLVFHEQYKQQRAKKYLQLKAEKKDTIKDIEYLLDSNEELCKMKHQELEAEIEYRGWRQRKEKAKDYFSMAVELGRNQRQEFYSLRDTIKE